MRSQSHKQEYLCWCKSKKRESVDLEFACGHVSKLLHELEIDLELNLIVKIQLSYSEFTLP